MYLRCMSDWRFSDPPNVATIAARQIVVRGIGVISRVAALVSLFVGVQACATVSNTAEAPADDEVVAIYGADLKRDVSAARDGLRELGFTIKELSRIDERSWRLIATHGVTGTSWGTVVRIIFERDASKNIRVRILTRRRALGNVLSKDNYAPDIFDKMDGKLTDPYYHPGS